MNNDIVESTCEILFKKYGTNVVIKFTDKINHHSGGNYTYWGELSTDIQIRHMNEFWRSMLIPLPNTVNIRAWLCEGKNISAYIDAFNENWSDAIIATGLLG